MLLHSVPSILHIMTSSTQALLSFNFCLFALSSFFSTLPCSVLPSCRTPLCTASVLVGAYLPRYPVFISPFILPISSPATSLNVLKIRVLDTIHTYRASSAATLSIAARWAYPENRERAGSRPPSSPSPTKHEQTLVSLPMFILKPFSLAATHFLSHNPVISSRGVPSSHFINTPTHNGLVALELRVVWVT